MAILEEITRLKIMALSTKDENDSAFIKGRIEELEASRISREQFIAQYGQAANGQELYNRLVEKEIELRKKAEQASAASDKKDAAARSAAAQEIFNKKLIETKTLYRDIRDLKEQFKSGDTTQGLDKMNAQASQFPTQIEGMKTYFKTLTEGTSEYLRMKDAIGAAEKEYRKLLAAMQQSAGGLTPLEKYGKVSERIYDTMTRMFRVAFTRFLREMWRDAIEYAQKYYDLLNEIRIVTGYTEEEANVMGRKFLDLAEKMSVSSVDIAKAATEYYRQGLGDEKVMERMTSTIQYAKISAIDFESAAKLITAATNAMGISGEKAADVFAVLGDLSAAGADEIGTAMQKATAAAKQFGLSFEWLGAYIATVSEKTRLPAETVGTAMNTILARLHAIRSTGYNSDDETRLNDIAKALEKINVSLLDQYGNWRPFNEVLDDIAVQWHDLDDVTQSYIATTMAGVRQQNTFLNLMQDLANQTEGGSRAFELYAAAVNSAGAATQKYAIYQQSVQAAQDNMKNSLEEMYHALDASGALKSFYNIIAWFVDALASGTKVMGAWNLKIPIMVMGLVSLSGIISKVVTGIKAIGAAIKAHSLMGLSSAVSGGWVKALIASLVLVVSAVTAIVGAIKNARDSIARARDTIVAFNETLQRTNQDMDSFKQLVDNLKAVELSTDGTVKSTQEYNAAMEALAKTSAGMRNELTNQEGKWIDVAEAIEKANAALEENARLNRDEAAVAGAKVLADDAMYSALKQRITEYRGALLATNLDFLPSGGGNQVTENMFQDIRDLAAYLKYDAFPATPLFGEDGEKRWF